MANNELNINEQIKSKEVRVIDNDGQMLGIVSTFKAISMARAEGLDLVEVSPNSEPPVCKIADYGKIRYQNQKKAAEAKKKQKIIETKEIKLSLRILFSTSNDFLVLGLYMLIPLCVPSHTNPLLSLKI